MKFMFERFLSASDSVIVYVLDKTAFDNLLNLKFFQLHSFVGTAHIYLSFQVVLLISRSSILSIFLISSLISKLSISNIFGHNSCLVFTVAQFVALWQAGIGGLSMAIYRYLCLEHPVLFNR